MSPDTRFDADEWNATYRPSPLTAAFELSPLACEPAEDTLTRLVGPPRIGAASPAESFAAFTSPAVATVAAFVTTPPVPYLTSATRVTSGKPAPGARESARPQVTTLRRAAQSQPSPAADTSSSSAGRVSTRVAVAVVGTQPALATRIV